MNKLVTAIVVFLIGWSALAAEIQTEFAQQARKVPSHELAEVAVQSHGRVKPLQTHARESILFLTGKYSLWGLDAVQLYLALSTFKQSAAVPLINVRDPELRTKLGFAKTERLFSLAQLEGSQLENLAKPIFQKIAQNERSATPDDKKVTEAMQQVWAARAMITGEHFLASLILDANALEHTRTGVNVLIKAKELLQSLEAGNEARAKAAASDLSALTRTQPAPELFARQLGRLGAEVFYNQLRPFFWAGLLYFLLGVLLVSGMLSKQLTKKRVFLALLLPVVLHAGGFGLRVWITGFAPVTNMFGTMVWMAFGVVVFGAVLFALYSHAFIYGLLLLGAASTLLLTESIPLILSPDLDPIVAVLRNNFWLTIHVLTVSISYAAFSISMLIGNAALVRTILRRPLRADQEKTHSHLAYRAIQLGVFFLTVGIILGGWWADYSWGRFWGWDPKETWALIADLGFLAILHARFLGWLGSFGILAAAPMSYLLVIMAWYGVNFILAAGLHSYGFSSGGTMIVVSFVTVQVLLFAGAMSVRAPIFAALRKKR